jgi:Cupin domain
VLTLQVDGQVIEAAAGTSVCVPRMAAHTFWNDSDQPCTSINVFAPAGFEQWFIRRVEMLEDGTATPESIARLADELGIVNLSALSDRLYTSAD